MISYEKPSGGFSFHFREVFQNCIKYIGKFLIQIREISKVGKKWYVFEEILGFISGSLPEKKKKKKKRERKKLTLLDSYNFFIFVSKIDTFQQICHP